jgi:hypothetical protein
MKTIQERLKDCVQLRSKLKYFGLDGYDELKPFIEHMNMYIRDGHSSEGTIAMPSIDRKFVYCLASQVGKECTILLKMI